MERTLPPDIFTATVAPLLQTAKQGGATARAISEAFVAAMADLYSDADLKETSAMLGFVELLKAEGGSVNAKSAARLYGGPATYSEEAVRKAYREGYVIGLKDGNGGLHFPVWQFGPRGGLLPGLKEILAVLAPKVAHDDLAAVTFLLNPSARLGGLSPLAALRRGDEALLAKVRALAAAAVE